MSVSNAQCIFDGSKFFWRTRNNVDISIIDHVSEEIYEVLFYEPSIDMEANRFYLDRNILHSLINNVEIENKTSFAKQNDIPLSTDFRNGLIAKGISSFLMDRIKLEKFSKEDRCLEISINLFEVDFTNEKAELLICSKPEGLIPFEVKHHKNVMADVVFQAMEAMHEQQKVLQSSCNTALELSDIAHKSLSIRDRWRIPLIMGKVGRGQRLNHNDQNIFRKVQFNLQGEDKEKSLEKNNNSSSVYSTTSTPRSCQTPPRTPTRLHMYYRKPSESTLCASTASSRLRYGTDEGTAAGRSPKTKKLSGPKRKKSSKGIKTRKSVSKEQSNITITSTSTTTCSSGSDSGIVYIDGNNDEVLVGDTETDELRISSHIQRLVSGFKTLGSSIKTSFSLNKSHSTFDSIPEHEDHSTAAATTILPIKPIKRNSYFGSFLQAIRGEPAEVPTPGTVDTTVISLEHNPERTKPTKRNSYFGSFVQALTGTTEASAGGDADKEEEAVQLGYLTIPALSHFLHRKSERGVNSRKVLPVE